MKLTNYLDIEDIEYLDIYQTNILHLFTRLLFVYFICCIILNQYLNIQNLRYLNNESV